MNGKVTIEEALVELIKTEKINNELLAEAVPSIVELASSVKLFLDTIVKALDNLPYTEDTESPELEDIEKVINDLKEENK